MQAVGGRAMARAEIPAPVCAAFDAQPVTVRAALLQVRDLILQAAAADPRIGPLTEALRWGEPAYLTEASGSGSTLRLGVAKKTGGAALFVNCRTDLVSSIRDLYGDTFGYAGAREVRLPGDIAGSADPIRHCATLVLTYHLRRRNPEPPCPTVGQLVSS
jgi:hypothetical protein